MLTDGVWEPIDFERKRLARHGGSEEQSVPHLVEKTLQLALCAANDGFTRVVNADGDDLPSALDGEFGAVLLVSGGIVELLALQERDTFT
jgi:hypothetical protein